MHVVTVPDFAGPRHKEFEWRSLFFLASWLEYAGEARNIPLHLACIGEPPPSVRSLCERCGAGWSVHEPLLLCDDKRHPNKLRGLEIENESERILLVDADVLVLGDFSELARDSSAICLAPAIKPRVSEEAWRSVYASLSRRMPDERITSVRHELGLGLYSRHPYPRQSDEMASMVPYYNSGILVARGPRRLRALWEESLRSLHALSTEETRPFRGALANSDQAALALSVQTLRDEGVPFRYLPHRLHSTYLHLLGQANGAADARLFHAFGLARSNRRESLEADQVVPRFGRALRRQLAREAWLAYRGHGRLSGWSKWIEARRAATALEERLTLLWKRHVARAIEISS